VDQGQFSDPVYISGTHQRENVQFADKSFSEQYCKENKTIPGNDKHAKKTKSFIVLIACNVIHRYSLLKEILKLVLTYIFSIRDEGCFLINLIVKTIQKYFARPYNS
jgi:hypothetical protein